jgi:hypothetical protein
LPITWVEFSQPSQRVAVEQLGTIQVGGLRRSGDKSRRMSGHRSQADVETGFRSRSIGALAAGVKAR